MKLINAKAIGNTCRILISYFTKTYYRYGKYV